MVDLLQTWVLCMFGVKADERTVGDEAGKLSLMHHAMSSKGLQHMSIEFSSKKKVKRGSQSLSIVSRSGTGNVNNKSQSGMGFFHQDEGRKL